MEFTQRTNISRNILMSIKKLKLNFIRNSLYNSFKSFASLVAME